MNIIAIRTDKPDAELYILKDKSIVAKKMWLAHKQLAETIHTSIRELLEQATLNYTDIGGIIVFTGQGSFTGLRIGTTVANALSNGLSVPVVASDGTEWIDAGIRSIESAQGSIFVVPNYGAPVHITLSSK